MEPTKPIGAVLILTMVEGDRPVTEVHPCHDCTLLNAGSVIRLCYFILIPFYEHPKVNAK